MIPRVSKVRRWTGLFFSKSSRGPVLRPIVALNKENIVGVGSDKTLYVLDERNIEDKV